MVDTDGGASGAPFPVTVGDLTITMRPCGWIDYVSSPRDFNAMLDQVQGGAFLQAFESLKGGGQITQIEGEKATQAIVRAQQ